MRRMTRLREGKGVRTSVAALAFLLGAVRSSTAAETAPAPNLELERTTYVEMIRRAAIERGAPPDLAEAVAQIESGYDPRVVGVVGEVGLMQVRPETAAMLGFKGLPVELARPSENVRYGVAYLAQAWRRADGNVCRALMKYRSGHNAEVMTPLSITYCQRARTYLATLGSPLSSGLGSAPPLVARSTPPTVARVPVCKRGTPECSRLFWSAHEARIRRIVARLQGERQRRGLLRYVTMQP